MQNKASDGGQEPVILTAHLSPENPNGSCFEIKSLVKSVNCHMPDVQNCLFLR